MLNFLLLVENLEKKVVGFLFFPFSIQLEILVCPPNELFDLNSVVRF